MPFCRFEIEVASSPDAVSQRVEAITRDAPDLWDSIKESFGVRNTGAAFIGTVGDGAFSLRRDIRYRNSFLPRIRGVVLRNPPGSRVRVTMYLHPLVAVFVLVWLVGAGTAAFASFTNSSTDGAASLIPAGMFAFGVALTLAGFYPEAYKARRLLKQAIRGSGGDGVAPNNRLLRDAAESALRASSSAPKPER